MDRKKLIIIASLILAVIIIIILLLVFSGGQSARDKTIKVIQRYLDKGEYDRALNLLEKLLLDNPDDEELQELQDTILEQKKQSEQAKSDEQLRQDQAQMDKLIDTVEKTGSQNPVVAINLPETTRPPAARETPPPRSTKDPKAKQISDLLTKGEYEREQGNYPAAVDLFNDVLKLDTGSAEANARLGQTYFEEKPDNAENIKKAIEYSNKAIKDDPSLARPQKTLGRIYDNEKNYAEAEHYYKQALRLDPRDWDTLYKLGVVQFRMKKYLDARQSFESCLKLKNDYAKAHFNRGRCCELLSDLNCALNAYTNAITYDPSLYVAYIQLGIIYSSDSKKEYTQAINAFEKAVQYAQSTASASELAKYYRYLADARIAREDFKDAEKALSSALQLEPANTDASYKLGVVKYNLEKYSEALNYAQYAVSQNPDNAEYNYQLGLIYEALKDSDNAIKYYQTAIQLNTSYAKPLTNLGRIYLEIGSYDTALQLLTAAYRLEPEDYKVNNNLGNVYLNKELYQDSIKHLQKAVGLQPDNTETRYNLGNAYKKVGRISEAKTVFNALIKIDSSYWDAYYEYALILIAEGDKTGAKTILQTLIAKKPDYTKRLEVDGLLGSL